MPSATPDGFLLSLIAALKPDSDPWNDLHRVLAAHGIAVQTSSTAPEKPSRLFNRDGQLIEKGLSPSKDWRARESRIRQYRVQHRLTLSDPEHRSAVIWQRYLQRMAAVQLLRAKGLSGPLGDRVRAVAFGDPDAAYLIAVNNAVTGTQASTPFSYSLCDTYTPLLRSAIVQYTAKRKRPAVFERDTPGLLYEAIVGKQGQRGYRADGVVDLARFLQRSIPQRIKALHHAFEDTGAPLTVMESAGDYGEKGPLSPTSIFGTDDPPNLEEQIDALAEQAAQPHREGFFSLLPARMEQDQEDQRVDRLWEALLAVAQTPQERQLIDAFRAAGPQPKVADIAKGLGYAASTVYSKWQNVHARAERSADLRRAARVPAPSRARGFWLPLRLPGLLPSLPAAPFIQFSPVRVYYAQHVLVRIWSLVELDRRGPIPLRVGGVPPGEVFTESPLCPPHIRDASQRIKAADLLRYPDRFSSMKTKQWGAVPLGLPEHRDLRPTVKPQGSKHARPSITVISVNVSAVGGVCNICGDHPHRVLVPYRGGPILCPRHPSRDAQWPDFPLTRFPRPWSGLGTPIAGAPSVLCKSCGGLVALEATYQRCLLCGRGEDIGGSDREVTLQDLIHKDLRPRFVYFRQPKRRAKTIAPAP